MTLGNDDELKFRRRIWLDSVGCIGRKRGKRWLGGMENMGHGSETLA